jgi:Cu-Zn family superoxide dismutase
MRKFHCIAAVLLALAAPAQAAQKAHAIARLKALDGKPVGSVDFAAVNRGVLITFDLHDLPPGAHAIHLHTFGQMRRKVRFHLGRADPDPDPRQAAWLSGRRGA